MKKEEQFMRTTISLNSGIMFITIILAIIAIVLLFQNAETKQILTTGETTPNIVNIENITLGQNGGWIICNDTGNFTVYKKDYIEKCCVNLDQDDEYYDNYDFVLLQTPIVMCVKNYNGTGGWAYDTPSGQWKNINAYECSHMEKTKIFESCLPMGQEKWGIFK
jgi:hypothetical protein